jgi:hypothetical protein
MRRRINEAAKTAELYRDVEKCVQKHLPKGIVLKSIDIDNLPHGNCEFDLSGIAQVYFEWYLDKYDDDYPEIITDIIVKYSIDIYHSSKGIRAVKSVHKQIEDLIEFMNSGEFDAALDEGWQM